MESRTRRSMRLLLLFALAFPVTVAVTVDPRYELVYHGVLDADLDTQVSRIVTHCSSKSSSCCSENQRE